MEKFMIKQYNLCFHNFNINKDRTITLSENKYPRLGAIHPEQEVMKYFARLTKFKLCLWQKTFRIKKMLKAS